MKISRIQLLFIAVFFAFTMQAQKTKYTPYDELPAVDKILKPNYSDDMPDWAKMLYQYPVNFNDVNKAFSSWEKQNKGLKSPIVRYYKLWRQHLEGYVLYDGTIELPDIKKLNESLARLQSAENQIQKAPALGNTSNWTFLGPKQTFWLNESGSAAAPKACPWQVNVYSIDVTDANPDVLYAGTETGFVNKSIDKGKTWSLLGLGYPFGGGIGAVAIHPFNTDTVYVSGGGAVHKSTDGGITWKRSGLVSANRLKINPTNPKQLVASTSTGVMINNSSATTAWVKKSSMECWDVEFKPKGSDTIFALTQAADNTFRVIQSVNRGESFAEISSFPTNIPQVSGGLIAVTPKNPNIMYVGMLSKDENAVALPYLYKGTFANGEWTWTKKATGKTSALALDNGQGYFDLVLEISPVNENIIYFGTTTLYKTSNGGLSFIAIGGYTGSFSIHPDIQDMKMLSNGDCWVATDGGINLSTDNFMNVNNHTALNSGLIGSDMWGFDQGWNEDVIVGGRYHNGNTAIADFYGNKALRMGGGESPTGWLLKGKSRHAAFDDLGNGWILPRTAEGKPEGRFIFSKYPNMDQYGALRSNVITHPNYSGTLYVGSANSIWVSKDFGLNFDLLYTFSGRVRYINMSSSNPNVMYADIEGSSYGFYRSTNGGVTWQKMTNPMAWNGQIAFAISPYDENVVYACKQRGAWDSFNSNMYRTENGGATWTQWSGTGTATALVNKSIKSIVVQPTGEGKDLVYAITSSLSTTAAKVYYRMVGDDNWTDYSTNYPAGMSPISAAAFYRDGKLRVAGNSGVWESPLVQPDFTPILVPWVDKQIHNCTADTIQLDDHSYINHSGASWKWEITPAPAYISNPNIRNPRILVSTPGKYSVKMTVNKNGTEYVKVMEDFFEVTSCPSIDDCSNPAKVPQNIWKLISADSNQPGNEPKNAFDGNASTIWHTPWGAEEPTHPHEISIDLGEIYTISKMTHVPRTDGQNGRIKDYELYISNDKINWGTAVVKSQFENISGPSNVKIDDVVGRYVKLVALSEVNDKNWTSLAELEFVGCRFTTGLNQLESDRSVNVFPVPANSMIQILLPFNTDLGSCDYAIYSSTGQAVLQSGHINATQNELIINVDNYPTGYYFVKLTDENGITFRAKFVKK